MRETNRQEGYGKKASNMSGRMSAGTSLKAKIMWMLVAVTLIPIGVLGVASYSSAAKSLDQEIRMAA